MWLAKLFGTAYLRIGLEHSLGILGLETRVMSGSRKGGGLGGNFIES